MPDSYTTGKLGLIEPARGGYVDTWDSPLYANWQTLEACISGTTTINLTSSNVVLTVPTYPTYANPPSVSTSAQNLRLLLTGTPSVNLTIFIPSTIAGFWIIDDQTGGSTTITIKTTAAGSVGVSSSRGNTLFIYCDGTDVKLADSGNVVSSSKLVIPGTIISFGGTVAPTGYLACDGSAVSRTTYSLLYAAIGSTWGAGDGSTTFNVPNLANMFLRGSGTSAVGVYEADSYLNHTHAVTDPGHLHTMTSSLDVKVDTSGAENSPHNVGATSTFSTNSNTTGISVNTSTTGGTETRPVNKRVLYVIKT